MQWEYKLVAVGLLVEATEPNQREKHEQILNNLGREGWEAVAYGAQSDTVLLKDPPGIPAKGKNPAALLIRRRRHLKS
jgi:Domain of unknown function (DUF4177)